MQLKELPLLLNSSRGTLFEDEIIEQVFIGNVNLKRDFWQDKNTTIDNETNKRITHKFRALPFQWAVINKVCLARIVEQSNVL